jgi:glycosyltransferase involved in cell wall biosynthesis
VIPNIAAPVFRPGRPPDEGPFRIVLAALWRPPKDHDVFIKALERMPAERLANCRIDWVGSGPDMDRIVHRCRAALPGADIRFPGLLPKEALAELMRSAHVFILPTTADNLPCVVLESLCCGTPVISMAVNGLPELIDASNGILVPPSDPAALAEAMLRCITQPGAFDRKAIAEAARKCYSADAVRAAILHVYSEIEHA